MECRKVKVVMVVTKRVLVVVRLRWKRVLKVWMRDFYTRWLTYLQSW